MAFSGMIAVTTLITTVIFVFLSALILWLTTKFIFKVNDNFKLALKIAAVLGAVSFVLSLLGMVVLMTAMGIISFIVGIALGLYLVKTWYKLEWGKAALVWLVWFVLGLVASFVLALILVPIFLAVGLASVGGGLF